MLTITIVEDTNTYSIHNINKSYNTCHVLELCCDRYPWYDIIRHVNSRVETESRDDYITVDLKNGIIYCNVIYPTNVTYILDIIADYCHVRKYHSTIKTNTIFPSNISKLLYKWIGRKKYDIENTRLCYYTTIACLVLMMLTSGFFVLFVQVLT